MVRVRQLKQLRTGINLTRFLKIFEKLKCKRQINFFQNHPVLIESHYGF